MTIDQLNTQELRLIELVRKLPESVVREVADFAAFKAARTGAWSYDDPASCAAAWDRATCDPTFVAEVNAIQREFAATEADGLDEEY
jgi:hypothetical protein